MKFVVKKIEWHILHIARQLVCHTGPLLLLLKLSTGGTLKTLDDQDEESLQGKWCPLEDVKPENPDLPLRATDILALLDAAVKYRESKEKPHPVLPVLNPHKKLLLRTVFVSHDG